MDHFAKLIAALFLSFAGTANAGYAQLSPPSGFGSVGGGFGYSAAANDAISGRLVTQAGALTANVGGQSVKMNVAYRFAANAPRFAAAAIFMNPYVRTGVGIASWLGVSGISWNSLNNTWGQAELPADSYKSDGYTWDAGPGCITGDPISAAKCRFVTLGGDLATVSGASVTYDAPGHALVTLNRTTGGTNQYGASRGVNSCPSGWYVTPAGCVQTPPLKQLSQNEMLDLLNPANQPGWPMPDSVPRELPPGTLLPVEQPVVNPSTGVNPFPQPLFVPSGDPVPNPNYDPNTAPGPNNQPYMQPGTRIVPSPTPSQPWRVDHQPVNRPQDDATPNPNPDAEPGTDPADKPKPEEQQSLCEKHPDIVACSKLGEPGQATPVPNESKTLTIAPENGFGPSGGSCPPPRTVEVAGLTLSMPFDLLCDFATGLKPVIVGLAWLTAAFTFMGIGRKS